MCFTNINPNMLLLRKIFQQLISLRLFSLPLYGKHIQIDLLLGLLLDSEQCMVQAHSPWMLAALIIIVMTTVGFKMTFKQLCLVERPIILASSNLSILLYAPEISSSLRFPWINLAVFLPHAFVLASSLPLLFLPFKLWTSNRTEMGSYYSTYSLCCIFFLIYIQSFNRRFEVAFQNTQ